MAKHAKLSPSASSRWINCPASVSENEKFEDESGEAADEGTILHDFCESALRDNLDALEMVGETRSYNDYEFTLDEEHANLVNNGLDLIDSLPGKLHIEHRVDLSRWLPGQFGTLDVGLSGKRLITIFDWKWGALPVSAVENTQLMIYALGYWDNIARHLTDATDFRLIIYQPRAVGGGGEWDVTLDELLDFGEYLKERGELALSEDAPFVPGSPQCNYCGGAKALSCSAYKQFMTSMFVDDLEELDEAAEYGLPMRVPKIDLLTPERKCLIVEHKGMIEKFLDRLYASVREDAEKGRPTPGLKLVEGRALPRKFSDEEAAEQTLKRLLGDDAFNRKLLSPTQAEEVLPPKMFAKLSDVIIRPTPSPSLVSIDDERPEITNLKDMFDD